MLMNGKSCLIPLLRKISHGQNQDFEKGFTFDKMCSKCCFYLAFYKILHEVFEPTWGFKQDLSFIKHRLIMNITSFDSCASDLLTVVKQMLYSCIIEGYKLLKSSNNMYLS